MTQLPRGIAPELLISQIENTMPYLFHTNEDYGHNAKAHAIRALLPSQVVLGLKAESLGELSHFEYFRLCLCAHFLTVGTPVPTDVDNQIRQKLWPRQLPLSEALKMADLVIDARKWDFTLLSARYVYGPQSSQWENEPVSGHLGEWFTVSCAAYCALKQYRDPQAQKKREEIFEKIQDEIHRHSEIFGALWRAGDCLGSLRAASSIAHNFGDLDRVMDMWELDVTDPLRLYYYKLTQLPFDNDGKLRFLGRLWVAGELYKSMIDGSSLAFENHRHFALRKPRALRKSPEFFIPTGPFFDSWGEKLAENLPANDLLEVIEALKHGWDRLPKTVGYARALRGIIAARPEHLGHFSGLSKASRTLIDVPKDRFEKKWASEALILMDDIPSRA